MDIIPKRLGSSELQKTITSNGCWTKRKLTGRRMEVMLHTRHDISTFNRMLLSTCNLN